MSEDIKSTSKIEERYRNLIDTSSEPFITLNKDGKIEDTNDAFVNITGVEHEQLIGSNFFNYCTEPEKISEVYKQIFIKGIVIDASLTFCHKDGKLTDVLFNGSVYKDDKGNVLGVVIVARDITAQKLLTNYVLSLIEASHDPLFTINPEGKITDMNNASVQVTGVSREKLIGTDFFNYFTDPAQAREGCQQFFEKGFVVDYPLTIRDKRLSDVLCNGSVYKDDRGNTLGLVVVARNVTAQKLLSKYSFSLIEASLDPLVSINTEGRIMDMNQAMVNISGVSRNKITGTYFFNYFTEPKKAREVYQEIFSKGSVTDLPLTLRHKDGKLTDVLFNGSVYKDDRGNTLGGVIVAKDVTDQKLLVKYLSLIEASYDPLFTISTEWKITDINHATEKATGKSREKLIGSNFYDYFTEPDRAREAYKQAFEKGFIVNYPLTIIDGKLTDVLCNGSVYKDDKGKILGVVIVARDITAQKRFENDLMEATSNAEREKQIAEEAVKSKQQFLANMSHEIRTPMNAIIGFTKVILKTDLNKKQKEYLNAIKLSGDALIVLINDILDLAKVNAGKMTFEHIPFRLSASIAAMLHLFETKIHEKNLELIKEYDDAIPDVLLGDPVRLHQIIMNLVSNAVKFTTVGKITMRVRILKEDAEKVSIEFSVIDTGIGIPESKLGNIFADFQQASSGTSRIYGGTGLGLSIVKQLVEPQGGTVTVKSEEGKGSTFSFVLSFTKTDAKVETETDMGIELEAGLKNIKVLVVEDMALNQLLMRTLLKDFGFEMDIAGNGKIAIEMLKKNTYDIILMDLQMPEMNGFEATEYIRNTMNSQIPIIALTADVTTVDVEKCRVVGMNDYVSKPIDEKLLYRKIIKYLKAPIPVAMGNK